MSDTQQVASEGELLISVRASEIAGWIASLQAYCGSRPVDAVAMCNDPVSEMRRCLERLQADVRVVLDRVVDCAGVDDHLRTAQWSISGGNTDTQDRGGGMRSWCDELKAWGMAE